MKASEVRRQVQQAPDKRQRLPPPEGSKSSRSYLSKYPETFKNKPENFTNLQSKTPRKEYPLVAEPGKNWVPRASGPAEKVRGVYNSNDRNKIDVVYHNAKESKDTAANFSLANYRPSRYPAEPEAGSRRSSEGRWNYQQR